jgi:6-pyruvoyl-tetrahydropterin synthase
VLDFRDIKEAVKDVLEGLDHFNLNELPAFKDENPTGKYCTNSNLKCGTKNWGRSLISTISLKNNLSATNLILFFQIHSGLCVPSNLFIS